MFIKTFINPFIGILMFLALLSLIIDVLMVPKADREWCHCYYYQYDGCYQWYSSFLSGVEIGKGTMP